MQASEGSLSSAACLHLSAEYQVEVVEKSLGV